MHQPGAVPMGILGQPTYPHPGQPTYPHPGHSPACPVHHHHQATNPKARTPGWGSPVTSYGYLMLDQHQTNKIAPS